jgi:hypothetical protein
VWNTRQEGSRKRSDSVGDHVLNGTQIHNQISGLGLDRMERKKLSDASGKIRTLKLLPSDSYCDPVLSVRHCSDDVVRSRNPRNWRKRNPFRRRTLERRGRPIRAFAFQFPHIQETAIEANHTVRQILKCGVEVLVERRDLVRIALYYF